jgi:hypothetical protein
MKRYGAAGSRVGCQEAHPGSDYTDDELEFLRAIDRYKKCGRRPHPSWREVLQVLLSLGYRKVAEPSDVPTIRSGQG